MREYGLRNSGCREIKFTETGLFIVPNRNPRESGITSIESILSDWNRLRSSVFDNLLLIDKPSNKKETFPNPCPCIIVSLGCPTEPRSLTNPNGTFVKKSAVVL